MKVDSKISGRNGRAKLTISLVKNSLMTLRPMIQLKVMMTPIEVAILA